MRQTSYGPRKTYATVKRFFVYTERPGGGPANRKTVLVETSTARTAIRWHTDGRCHQTNDLITLLEKQVRQGVMREVSAVDAEQIKKEIGVSESSR
jgi:hypothetical protein